MKVNLYFSGQVTKPRRKFNFAGMNLPEAFQITMKQKLGDQFDRFSYSLSEPAPTSIRLNPGKINRVSFDSPVLWTDCGKYINARPVFTLDPFFHGGTYYVQEASSMFLEQALKQVADLAKPLNVLDLAAAPGGKSTHIVSLISDKSLLVSNEVIRSRAAILSENIVKWGYPNVIVTNNDPKDFKPFTGFFDVVVLDAPCSGEGLFRKDPNAMQEWSPQNVALCAGRQKRIIADIWPSLKENGVLIYCTCTYNDAENENNLLWMKEHYNLESVPLKIQDAWGIEEVSVNEMKGYRFFPHRVKGEGFFISVIRKKENTPAPFFKPGKKIPVPSKKTIESLRTWIHDPDDFIFYQHQDLIYFVPGSKADQVNFLIQHLKIIHAGTRMATEKHEKLIPDHALALSIKLNRDSFKTFNVTREEALQYLRRENLIRNEPRKGFYLITFEGVPLGWVNNLGTRINNLYPQEWRIRMSR